MLYEPTPKVFAHRHPTRFYIPKVCFAAEERAWLVAYSYKCPLLAGDGVLVKAEPGFGRIVAGMRRDPDRISKVSQPILDFRTLARTEVLDLKFR
jgi:hypothetical protein